MDKRYLIFISSTYSDLITERDKVTQAVLELNHFPAGMEQFPAVGIPPIELIKSYLKECDYYILIVAARYGSTYEDGSNRGKSFTEVEYDIATELGIPVIAFLHNDIKSIPSGKTDEDDVKREKLLKFRAKVEKGNQTVKYWSNPDDLKSKVLSSIPSAIKYQERTGWIRANVLVIMDDLQKRIDKLQKKNDLLIKQSTRDEGLLLNLKKSNKSLSEEKDQLWGELTAFKERIIEKEQAFQKAQSTIKKLEVELERLKMLVPVQEEPEKKTFYAKRVAFTMVHVKGGSFMMGANENDYEARNNEKPARKVTLKDFWIGETQVTQELWLAIMGSNPSYFDGKPNLPVENISWQDCESFIDKLNKETQLNFRLPSEAEWEFAARGGNNGKDITHRFSGGDNIRDLAWYCENSDEKTHPVKQLNPNELGLYDMSGNVWERCADDYAITYKMIGNQRITNKESVFKVCRGGSWRNTSGYCRISHKGRTTKTSRHSNIGLRLALSL